MNHKPGQPQQNLNDSDPQFLQVGPSSLYNSTHHFQSINPAPIHSQQRFSNNQTHASLVYQSQPASTVQNSNKLNIGPNNNNYFNSTLSSFTSINKNNPPKSVSAFQNSLNLLVYKLHTFLSV